MKLIFSDEAWDDYLNWHKQDRKMVERISKLIQEVRREPFSGLGKPEPLKHALAGFWSRRITDEHRMVYRVEGDALLLAQLRYHYLTPTPNPMETLEAEAFSLTAAGRPRLLDRLIATQDADPAVEQAWMAEAKRRDEEIESGAVELIPGHMAMASLRARLR